jgi:Big-like domain-containing protein
MKNYLVVLLVIVFLGCSKDEDNTEQDNELPVIVINSPDNNQVFNAGARVIITGSVTDNKQVDELHIHVSDVFTGALLIDIHRAPETSSYSLNESFQAQSGIDYKIQVIAKDNSNNENRASVEISTN